MEGSWYWHRETKAITNSLLLSSSGVASVCILVVRAGWGAEEERGRKEGDVRSCTVVSDT